MQVVTSSPNPFEGPYSSFLRTYKGPQLTIYTEAISVPGETPDGHIVLPMSDVEGLAEFLGFLEHIPATTGDWRFDVRRFCRKSFVWFQAHKDGKGPMFWLDSDVTFNAPLEADFLLSLLGREDMCYLGRRAFHPCSSFVGWQRNGKTEAFMQALRNLYESTMFLRLHEWHDAYLMGEVIASAPSHFQARNLSPKAIAASNPFDHIFECAVHHKGPRKFRDAAA